MISANFIGVLFVSLLIANFVYSTCIVEVDNQTSEDLECTVQYNSSKGHFTDGKRSLNRVLYFQLIIIFVEFQACLLKASHLLDITESGSSISSSMRFTQFAIIMDKSSHRIISIKMSVQSTRLVQSLKKDRMRNSNKFRSIINAFNHLYYYNMI